ncbi:hypothetical protein [Lyngbya sp. PCC 8106]|uniref:hypothetical protein n=1 Tax=Lyngbya sp. (strain PCC 8106) TaxID=313612 RepID=UPI0000EAB62E|nr:hypothetical protein [Lyngbya sp. PCC 8106]EAW35985.1 hypothetical protein L8106_22356 [Lyngbya sp. PCC 8106]
MKIITHQDFVEKQSGSVDHYLNGLQNILKPYQASVTANSIEIEIEVNLNNGGSI